jgi:hypothetical protein
MRTTEQAWSAAPLSPEGLTRAMEEPPRVATRRVRSAIYRRAKVRAIRPMGDARALARASD